MRTRGNKTLEIVRFVVQKQSQSQRAATREITSNIERVPLRYISSPGGCLRSHFLWMFRVKFLIHTVIDKLVKEIDLVALIMHTINYRFATKHEFLHEEAIVKARTN